MSELLENFEDGVLTLTINRPDAHNTLNVEFADQLNDALQRATDNADVRCLVLTGAGKVFCAGGDVGVQVSGIVEEKDEDPEIAREALAKQIRSGMIFSELLYNFPKPTLAVVNGAAAGAGLALALACDFRFCLDTAKLTTAFAKIGISSDSGIAYLLPRIVGDAKARELCFFSDVITGSEALDIGLVTQIANAENFAEASKAYAERLASLPTVAMSYMKNNLSMSESLSLSEMCDFESDNVAHCMGTSDHKRAAAAFLNKEPVTFEGR